MHLGADYDFDRAVSYARFAEILGLTGPESFVLCRVDSDVGALR